MQIVFITIQYPVLNMLLVDFKKIADLQVHLCMLPKREWLINKQKFYLIVFLVYVGDY